MVQRWAAAAFLATGKNFCRIMGWKDLWQLETILGRKVADDAATMQEVAYDVESDRSFNLQLRAGHRLVAKYRVMNPILAVNDRSG